MVSRKLVVRSDPLRAPSKRSCPHVEVKQQNLTFGQKLQVIDFYWKYMGYLTLEQMVGPLRESGFLTICATTITRCIQQEERIRKYVSGDLTRLRHKRETLVQLPEVEQALLVWIAQKLANNARLTGEIIMAKAHDFCNLFGISQANRLEFSRGWLGAFKKRHGLHQVTFHGERASVPRQYIKFECERLLPILRWYAPWDRYNVDETGLFWRMPPGHGLGTHESGGLKGDKSRITYVLGSNQDGSHKLPPLVIGKAAHPNCFGRNRSVASYGFWYTSNKKAWMNKILWKSYLHYLDEMMGREGRRILLICDNASSHKHDASTFTNLHIEFLSPNLTPWLQPMDAGVIAAFKSQYRRRFARLAIRRDDAGIANIYKINQLEAMKIAADAWESISPETISNCWKHTGIVPRDSDSLPLNTSVNNPTPARDRIPMPRTELDDFNYEELGLDGAYIHPDVYATMNYISQSVATEEELTDEQITLGMDRMQLE
ncbi:Tigger transposable element-derived protein 6 OS=Homo sapiens GN=TIGD6 PE=2 SV=2 [Rhizoctonia solani AG-1 IB]|uniref:Tigger transposable element-derived protein 6 n=1 Tax=Thanatephorus cucumeris (strain AG1-IB / isolate 7/3/14) TaxID=1108050 RepID=M5BKB2_THACB|nr:Tigger transposable element-derived protein 6 [Rhizoctonia solani AG-1 IB]CEL60904.1 Tigger transposable element-derived protein 6 OS=Homo sapiens GN=TIGD6 PE=2 SV=2 [Rhizoctonia solani AG-1 IB]